METRPSIIGSVVLGMALILGILPACGDAGPLGGGIPIGGATSNTGSGGNPAAPTGGSTAPVAVELPALEEAADLLYVTSVVVDDGMSGGAVITTGKSYSSGAEVAGIGIGDDPFKDNENMSLAACETTNRFRDVLKSASATDHTLCVLQQDIAPAVSEDGIDIYDGEFHDARLQITELGETSVADVRFRLVRDGKALRLFEIFACSDGQQVHYNRQTIEKAVVTIFGKDISPEYRTTVNVRGELNSLLQFGSKRVESAGHGKGGGGQESTKETMWQYPSSATLDGFHYVDKGHEYVSRRIYSGFDLGYAGSPLYPDPMQYFIGNGAGHVIIDQQDFLHAVSNTRDVTESWNSSGDVDPEAGGEYLELVRGQPPRDVERVVISDFEGDEVVDCGSIQPQLTVTLDMDHNACKRFAVEHDFIECLKN